MVSWTIPEYIEAHPTEYPGTIITKFCPNAPPESNDKLSEWYKQGYNHLYEEIQQYQEYLDDGETPPVALKMALLTWGMVNLTEEKDPISTEPIVTAPDDEDPIADNNSGLGQGIRTYTMIGGDIVSKDIISITATMSSGYDEGNEQASCVVTLNNNYQKYGKKISSYEWAPKITRIWSQAAIDFNTDNGVETSTYMIFQGFMSDAKYNNEIATVTFGCISIEAAGSFDDETWSPEDGYETKMRDTIDKINDSTDADIKLLNLKQNISQLIKQDYTPSDLSGNESLRSIAQDNKESFYFGHDFADNVYVVLTDSDSYTETMFLDPYVIEPADTSTIFGHANTITVIAGSTNADETLRHIPTSVKDEIFAYKENWDSIYRYGKTESDITHDPNLLSVQADVEADLEEDNFQQYIDRDIKVVVVNRIPKIFSLVLFQVPDIITEELTWIYGGVRKKEVEYSSAGIITHLEVARIDVNHGNELTASEGPVTLQTDKYESLDGQIWQAVFRNGRWLYGQSGNSLQTLFQYSEYSNAPAEVTSHFAEQIKNIESANNQNSPNWKSMY